MERNPGWVLGRMLIASVFIVMGAWRLMARADGQAIGDATLVFSTLELALGLLIASGWRLRWTAALAAVAMLVDAVLSHPFWTFAGAELGAQLLHFMKNIALIGGLVLLAAADRPRRH
ncbi:MAG TPA: hypothetical protein VGD42_13245 [Lysobacter sp.]